MVLPLELVEAAKAGNVTAVREWLESGGDPNDTDSRGCTLLLKVVITGEISDAHLDVARLLLSHGADVNKSDVDSFTPLHCCAIFPKQSSRGPLIQLLLDAGRSLGTPTSHPLEPGGRLDSKGRGGKKGGKANCSETTTRCGTSEPPHQ